MENKNENVATKVEETKPTEQTTPSNNVEQKKDPNNNSNATPKTKEELDKEEKKRMNAMTGNFKEQITKLVHSENDKTIKIDDFPAQATIYIKNCKNSEIHVDSLSTKVNIESCVNCKIFLNQKVVTSVVDIWKCDGCTLTLCTKTGTLQADMCTKFNVVYKKVEDFVSIVWAQVFDMNINFEDSPKDHMLTGFEQAKTLHPNIVQTLDQFIIRFVNGKLLNEQIVRLENGFPTTEREAKEFDERQERNLQILAKNIGVSVGKKKAEKKQKPNEQCDCGSGKKYKKCHGEIKP